MVCSRVLYCFVSLLVVQTSARLQISRSTKQRRAINQSWGDILKGVEGTLRADCGEACVGVLRAYFPFGGLSNETSEESVKSSLQSIAEEVARQVRLCMKQSTGSCTCIIYDVSKIPLSFARCRCPLPLPVSPSEFLSGAVAALGCLHGTPWLWHTHTLQRC